MSKSSPGTVPVSKKWLVDGFCRYCKPFVRKHFHTFAADGRSLRDVTIEPEVPVIVFGNHPGWWDPVIAMFSNQRFVFGRTMYAPIDSSALEKYGIFRKLGFFGIDLHSTRGAADFLKTSRAIMAQPNTALWLTPEGRFADPRDFAAPLMPGLAHLAHDAPNAALIPVAMEYPFWEERLPEMLVRFGDVIWTRDYPGKTKTEWNDLLTQRLRLTQTQLAESSIARRTEDFEILISSKLRRSWYDFFRMLAARARGRTMEVEHGKKFVESPPQEASAIEQ